MADRSSIRTDTLDHGTSNRNGNLDSHLSSEPGLEKHLSQTNMESGIPFQEVVRDEFNQPEGCWLDSSEPSTNELSGSSRTRRETRLAT